MVFRAALFTLLQYVSHRIKEALNLHIEKRFPINTLFVSLVIHLLDSIVVSIPACHAGDRGSIPRRGGYLFLLNINASG